MRYVQLCTFFVRHLLCTILGIAFFAFVMYNSGKRLIFTTFGHRLSYVVCVTLFYI